MKQADEDKKSPNSCYGGGGHTKTFPGANVYTQTHSGRSVLVDEAAGQICLQAGNTNRRQQLVGSEDSLGHQQGAEDAEWSYLAGVEGTRQPWLANSLEEGKLQTETRLRQGLHQTCLREGKPKEKTGLRASPHEPCHRRRRTVNMRRVLPTKLIVHAPTTLWPCNYLWNGVVLSFWIVAREGQHRAPSLKGAQPQLPTVTLTPLV